MHCVLYSVVTNIKVNCLILLPDLYIWMFKVFLGDFCPVIENVRGTFTDVKSRVDQLFMSYSFVCVLDFSLWNSAEFIIHGTLAWWKWRFNRLGWWVMKKDKLPKFRVYVKNKLYPVYLYTDKDTDKDPYLDTDKMYPDFR